MLARATCDRVTACPRKLTANAYRKPWHKHGWPGTTSPPKGYKVKPWELNSEGFNLYLLSAVSPPNPCPRQTMERHNTRQYHRSDLGSPQCNLNLYRICVWGRDPSLEFGKTPPKSCPWPNPPKNMPNIFPVHHQNSKVDLSHPRCCGSLWS